MVLPTFAQENLSPRKSAFQIEPGEVSNPGRTRSKGALVKSVSTQKHGSLLLKLSLVSEYKTPTERGTENQWRSWTIVTSKQRTVRYLGNLFLTQKWAELNDLITKRFIQNFFTEQKSSDERAAPKTPSNCLPQSLDVLDSWSGASRACYSSQRYHKQAKSSLVMTRITKDRLTFVDFRGFHKCTATLWCQHTITDKLKWKPRQIASTD
jgi:hypothetical protein